MDERELRQIGPYPVVRFLSEGGMAWVYEVTDPRFGVRRALKMLKPEAGAGAEFQRFESEARILAAVEHPNLVTIYDLGRDAATGCLYYTMSFVDGPSGSELDRPGAERACEIVLDALDGLAALHERGVIHRDVKPANILVDRRTGRALLGDLGIARTQAGSGLTRTGTMIGTALYMSPEQARGRPVDRSSDVFSMGLTLYRLLTGRVAYDEVKDLDTTSGVEVVMYLGSLVHSRSELQLHFPRSVPGALRRVVLRACRVDPGERYPDAGAMRAALREALVEVRRTGRRGRRRAGPLVAGLLLAAGAAAAALWWQPELLGRLRSALPVAQPVTRPTRTPPSPPRSPAPAAPRRPAAVPNAPRPAEVAQPPSAASAAAAAARTEPAALAPPAPAEDPRLRELLDRAAEQVTALRLTTPEGDNALESYRTVLALAPGDARARTGIEHIRDRYLEWGERAEKAGELAKALEYYRRALTALPDDAEASFRAEFVAERIDAERARAREQAEAEARAAAEAEARRQAAARTETAPAPATPTARATPAAAGAADDDDVPDALAGLPPAERELELRARRLREAAARTAAATPRAALAPQATSERKAPADDMVAISAGAAGDAGPAVDAFELDRTEVTVERYQACVAAGACEPVRRHGSCNESHDDRGDHPANCVSYRQAEAYCAWAGKRLPTGAEWERAARSDTARTWPWGDEEPTCDQAVLMIRGHRPGCDHNGTWPVGSKPAGASPFGALDLAGNVWEWTWDPGKEQSVLRGGAWNVDARQSAATWIYPYPETKGTSSTGFRCAR